MDYKILTQEEQDDITASFLASQERDEFCHQTNLARYKAMLKSLPEGKWKQQVASLHDETVERLAEVQSIIAATELPPAERLTAAKNRIKAAKPQ